MPSILRRRVQTTPQQIDNTGTGTTLLTFGENLVEGGAIVVGFSICVNGASARVVKVRLVPSGATPGDEHNLYHQSVAAATTVTRKGPWWENSSATLVGLSDNAANDVTVTPTCFEEVQQS